MLHLVCVILESVAIRNIIAPMAPALFLYNALQMVSSHAGKKKIFSNNHFKTWLKKYISSHNVLFFSPYSPDSLHHAVKLLPLPCLLIIPARTGIRGVKSILLSFFLLPKAVFSCVPGNQVPGLQWIGQGAHGVRVAGLNASFWCAFSRAVSLVLCWQCEQSSVVRLIN